MRRQEEGKEIILLLLVKEKNIFGNHEEAMTRIILHLVMQHDPKKHEEKFGG